MIITNPRDLTLYISSTAAPPCCFLSSRITNHAIKQQDMIHRIKSSAKRLLHKVLPFHFLSDPDDMDEHHRDLFPQAPEHIITYCRTLAMKNDAIGTKELQSYQISAIDGFKTVALSKHEYGRAKVLVPGTKTFPLAFERMQGKSIDVDTAFSKSPNTEPEASNPITPPRSDLRTFTAQIALSSKTSFNSFHSKTSLESPSTSISPQRFADDRIATLPKSGMWNADDNHLFTLTFPSKKLYLYELAFLIEVIHQENQSYNILSNNCYHLVGITAAALMITHNAVLSPSDDHTHTGKCCRINFFANGRKDIAIICRKSQQRLQGFVTLLYVLSD
jgi:hypothetical protein